MAPNNAQVFSGVIYHIGTCCGDTEAIRHLLDENGAKQSSGPKFATRIISDQCHFAIFKALNCKGAMVTPEWVYSSAKAGIKKPSQYYSADPAMFFSCVVVSTVGLSVAEADRIRTGSPVTGGNGLRLLRTRSLISSLIPPPAWIFKGVLLPTEPYEMLKICHPEVATRRICNARKKFYSYPTSAVSDMLEIRTSAPLPLLPFEILAKIFINFRDIVLNEPLPSFSHLLRLSQVCTRRREIAHHTRAFWTHIPLNFHCEPHYNRINKLLEQWAVRSHQRPLALTVRSCYPSTHNPIIDFILVHASRIRELSLDLPAVHFHSLLQAPAGSFPMLETLSLSIIAKTNTVYDPSCGFSRFEYFQNNDYFDGEPDSGGLWDTMEVGITALGNTTQLRSISVDSSGFVNLNPRMLPLNWGNLSYINLGSVALSVHDTAYLLPQCTGVERLSFTTDVASGESMPLIPPLRLPQLTALDWCGFDVDDVSLKLHSGCKDTLQSLHAHAPFALRDLTLVFFYLTLPGFSTFLRKMPSLVSLELRMSFDVTDDLLAFLTYEATYNRREE
ncbi:hypothetical protein B0H19DRAFT_1273993 [Mycena capillaripes]|nr:hypothetical protein B0H19DRAFT_1273993 [Mycena capillaripes]